MTHALHSRQPRRHLLWLVLILALLPLSPLPADTIFKKDGREVVGKIIAEEESRVMIEVQMGKMTAKIWVPRKEISRIERGATPTDEFEERLSKIQPHDVPAYEKLADWAKKNRLRDQERYVRSLIPAAKIQARKHQHPRTWCRGCDADGEASCKPCDGTGEHIDKCERCDGVGANDCKICKGVDGNQVRCRRCAGEGEYEKFDPARGRKVTQKCKDCRGEGLRDCPICQSKGVVECGECEGKKGVVTDCTTCSGKPTHSCKVCRGTGLQPTPLTDAEFAKEQAELKKKAKEETAAAVGEKPKGGKKKEPEKESGVIKGNPFGD